MEAVATPASRYFAGLIFEKALVSISSRLAPWQNGSRWLLMGTIAEIYTSENHKETRMLQFGREGPVWLSAGPNITRQATACVTLRRYNLVCFSLHGRLLRGHVFICSQYSRYLYPISDNAAVLQSPCWIVEFVRSPDSFDPRQGHCSYWWALLIRCLIKTSMMMSYTQMCQN